MKKVLKVIAIIIAIAGCAAAVYAIVKKFLDKKEVEAPVEEEYVSADLADDEFVTETVA
ncbi:MAG: hypothetical protein IK118_02195 [Clostridia bacterium]|nr:hypothetical protein [Clostridia bacterium]MBR5427134.1 hypothetical protein [Clostridia bacterium]